MANRILDIGFGQLNGEQMHVRATALATRPKTFARGPGETVFEALFE
jgi:hypothetical protein